MSFIKCVLRRDVPCYSKFPRYSKYTPRRRTTRHTCGHLSLLRAGVYTCLSTSVCLSLCLSLPTQPTNQPLTVTPVGRSQPASKQRARQLVRLHTKASN
jgi:hypothetical protein